MKLFVAEKFVSLNGEHNCVPQGEFTAFIRLSGCNLQCEYCDTKKTQVMGSGEQLSVAELVQWAIECRDKGVRHFLITGGEPLMQPAGLHALVRALNEGVRIYYISIETNGTLPIPDFMEEDDVRWVMDVKERHHRSSQELIQEAERLLPSAVQYKYVITNRPCYDWAVEHSRPLVEQGLQVSFSPVMDEGIPFDSLLKWMEEDELYRVMYNLQIHKFIGAR